MGAKPEARKRAGGTRGGGGGGGKRKPRSTRDELLVWRGYVLVSVGAGALAAAASAWYALKDDFLTAALFSMSLVVLMFVGVFALGRVRQIRARAAGRHAPR